MINLTTYHIGVFFRNFFFWNFFLKFFLSKKHSKKNSYLISWKNNHFTLLTFFEILNFWILKNLKIDIFHQNGKMPSFLWLKNNSLYANLTTRCQKVENILLRTNSKLLPNLTGWKTEYLIAQLRTGFQQKVFRLKTCPQGVLQAQ
jgi:hypothetical protein